MHSGVNISPSAEQWLFQSSTDLVDEALSLAHSNLADSEDSVHRIRVILKILRSRQQLIRPFVHPNSYRSANQRIKSAADQLAGRRDGDVLLKTHAKLLKKTSGKKTSKSMKALTLGTSQGDRFGTDRLEDREKAPRCRGGILETSDRQQGL